MGYVTTAEVIRHIGIPTTHAAGDTLISDLLADSQAWLEAELGRKLGPFSATRYYDPTVDVDDDEILWLDEDLLELTLITCNDGTTLGTSDTVLLPSNESPKYGIQVRSDSSRSFDYDDYHENAVAVRGTWGYSTAAHRDLQLTLKELVHYCYDHRASPIWDVTFLSPGVVSVPDGFPRRAYRSVMMHRKHTL